MGSVTLTFSRESRIDQPGDVASLGALHAHDGGLRAAVYEGFHGEAFYFEVYIQHGYPTYVCNVKLKK